MELGVLLSALVKNGPLIVIAGIFLKTYMDDTRIKREERKEDRAIQRDSNNKLAEISEKFAVGAEKTNQELCGLNNKLEVHSSSSQTALAEIKQGVNQIQKDVTILNNKIDDIAEDMDKSA
ncbi:MAG: hypothetical protein SOR60_04570 [Anaerococcus porci]|nr:hypothetical protein [Anaerococcus porci]